MVWKILEVQGLKSKKLPLTFVPARFRDRVSVCETNFSSAVKSSQPDKKTTDIANVLTLPAKRAGQAGRVMSTCRPLARLFLSPSSAHSLKCGRALSVVKGQEVGNKLLSLTVRH
jgi:hypothetical protein